MAIVKQGQPLFRCKSASAKETAALGAALGKSAAPGSVLALVGDLGSGKTIFVQGLARGLGIRKPEEIRSPTFALIQEHRGRIALCHVDLYRLSEPETAELGLEEYWQGGMAQDWVVAIEWANRAERFLAASAPPERVLEVRFEVKGERAREISFLGYPLWKKIVRQLSS